MTPCSSSRTSEPPLRIASIARSGVRQEGATGWCQDHARMRSPEQGGAKFLLERLKPGGERRLADREGERGASHVPLSGDLDEPFDLREEQWNHLRW